ncbi:MAG: nodulation protein NfeD [Acidimicrobiia bacterium]|nr:nodulation protein NfeD [Acidimicrobiia bacterium]
MRLVAAMVLLAASAPEQPTAVVAEYDGIIHPIAAEFLTGAIDEADRVNADLVVFVLRTPGGLMDSMRDIVSRMVSSRAPVVVFVGPSGSRAASAGFLLALAADVAVMAPGTHIGAAHPVSGSGEPMDETMAQKAASDAAAYARSLAAPRGRNEELAAEAVTESRAFTDQEALNASPPLIDFIARDVPDLLRTLDGREIRRFDGRTASLATAGIATTAVEMSRRQQFLAAIAHPQIAYLLLSLGILGLTVELWTPGAVLPGVAGGLCLLLAFFALQVLPVNAVGVLLILFGVGLLLLELMVPSFGALGIGGTISVLVGSLMLTDTVPGVSVSRPLVFAVTGTLAALVLFLGRLAIQAQRAPTAMGMEALAGVEARTIEALAAGGEGQVRVHGEIWRARSRQPLPAGARVRVTGADGLTLTVEPVDAAPSKGEA